MAQTPLWYSKYWAVWSGIQFLIAIAFFCFGVVPYFNLAVGAGMAVASFKYKNDHNRELAASAPVEAIEPKEPTEFDCEQYEQRLWEQKLVDADLMKSIDMSVCDDRTCPNCKFTRLAIESHERAISRELQEKANADEMTRKIERYREDDSLPDFQRYKFLFKYDDEFRAKYQDYKHFEYEMKCKRGDFYSGNQNFSMDTLKPRPASIVHFEDYYEVQDHNGRVVKKVRL